MNKKTLLPLIALLLVACTNNDVPSSGQENNQTGAVPNITRYVTMSVMPSPVTRADESYQNGTPTENAVNKVRFYFFSEDGKPFPVWENKGTGNGNYNSYIDWYPNATDSVTASGNNSLIEGETVEKILNVTLSLAIPANMPDPQPSSVVAVLNPPQSLNQAFTSSTEDLGQYTITINGPSLGDLTANVADYRTGLMSEGNFVMSNSVYVDESGDIVNATIITEDNFGATQEQAQADPVVIYVERVLARLDFVLNLDSNINPPTELSDGSVIYYLGQYKVYNGTNDAVQEVENIYLKLLGWNITGTSNYSRLVKMIDSSWTNSSLFGENSQTLWNSDDYHRSFWGVNPNPATTGYDYLFGDFSGEASSNNFSAQGIPFDPSTSTYTTYLQENANNYNVGTNGIIAPAAPEYATDVIIAAQLTDATGKPYPLCEWNYYKYTFPQLQAKMISGVFANLYKKTVADGATTYSSINADDFTFATAQSLGIEDEDEANYYVYPVLTETAESYTWTLGNTQDATEMSAAEVNTYMRDAVNHVMVWNEGMTYYFFSIQHLGELGSPAFLGVVRNHLYLSTLSSITGLGTPVYDETETIYPEKTENENNVVTATIQILQWRIVAQQYNLEW